MYKILGSDLREYGPVNQEQVVLWIHEGRADAQTRALPEGASEWKSLSALPEFAAALAAKAAASAPPPPPGGAAGAPPPPISTPPPIAPPPPPPPKFDSDAMANRVLARGLLIDPVHCVSRSWDLLTNNFWLLVGATFVVHVLANAVPLIRGVLLGGLYLLFLKLIRKQKADFGDAFAGFSDAFLPLFLVGLVSSLLTGLGFLFCIIPGVYLLVAWFFAIPLVMDKRLDFWPAMMVSMRVVNGNWFQFFLLGVLNVLVCLLGLIAFCIGIYVALPIAFGAIAYAYEDVFSAEPPAPARPL